MAAVEQEAIDPRGQDVEDAVDETASATSYTSNSSYSYSVTATDSEDEELEVNMIVEDIQIDGSEMSGQTASFDGPYIDGDDDILDDLEMIDVGGIGAPVDTDENTLEDSVGVHSVDGQALVGRSSYMAIFFSILSFVLSGLTIVTYNRWFLHYDNFDFPFSMISFQLFVQFWLSLIIVVKFFPDEFQYGQYSPFRVFITDGIRGILHSYRIFFPIAFAFALDICMSNAALVTMSVSAVEIIKASMPGMIIFYYMWIIPRFDRRSPLPYITIILLCTGIALSSLSDATFNVPGASLALIASFCGCFKLILMESVLEYVHPFSLLLWLAPAGSLILLIPSLAFEFADLSTSQFFDNETDSFGTIVHLLLAAVLACWLNVSTLFVVKHTSSATISVVGTARLVLIILFTSWLFHREVDNVNIIGICVAVVGVGMYQFVRRQANKLAEEGTVPKTKNEDRSVESALRRRMAKNQGYSQPHAVELDANP